MKKLLFSMAALCLFISLNSCSADEYAGDTNSEVVPSFLNTIGNENGNGNGEGDNGDKDDDKDRTKK